MLIFLEKMFDKKRCDFLSKVVIAYHEVKRMSYEGGNDHYKNSYGRGNIKEFEDILLELTPIVKEKTGIKNIIPQNSYCRIYLNDSVLKKHVDRKDLDITLSACVYDDTGVDWPLHVETDEGVKSVITRPGDGAMILGTRMVHWRDHFFCGEDKKIIQCFFHWKIWRNFS